MGLLIWHLHPFKQATQNSELLYENRSTQRPQLQHLGCEKQGTFSTSFLQPQLDFAKLEGTCDSLKAQMIDTKPWPAEGGHLKEWQRKRKNMCQQFGVCTA